MQKTCYSSSPHTVRTRHFPSTLRAETMPAKRLLRSRDKRFRILFQEHPQPMWILDPQGQHLEANAAACALYGYSSEEFSQLSVGDFQSPDDTRRFLSELHNPARPAAS